MADNNRSATEEMEELLRREMPLLEVPGTLSAASVAERLKDSTPRRKTPIYVYVRAAAAAVLVLAVGLWVYGRFSSINMKAADAGDETYSENAAMQPSDMDDGLDVMEDSAGPVPVTGDAEAGYSAEPKQEDGVRIGITKGETFTVSTEVPFSGASFERESGTTTQCDVVLEEAEDGTVSVKLTADGPGEDRITLLSGGAPVLKLTVTVE